MALLSQKKANKNTLGAPANTLSERWTPRALFRLMWPLVVEQLFAVSIGMADTVMVAGVGEAAVSGVSLVDAINILLINAFTALATGGAVVASQYLGRKERAHACSAARQLVYVITVVSSLIMVMVLVLHRVLINFIYGAVDSSIMQGAETYLWISALSYPFIGLYNAGAAIFRSMGNSKMGMVIALLVNIINIGGNSLLIYTFGLGVAGAAISTLISRAVAAIVLIRLLLKVHAGPITLAGLFRFHFSKTIIKQILRIGLPNGLENSMFQIGKLMVARIVAGFGTAAIAANAIANSITTVATLPGQAFGLALLTVVGQCVGAHDYAAAKRNTRRLMLTAIASISLLSLILVFLRIPLLSAFGLSNAAVMLGGQLLLLFFVAAPILWPPSFAMPNVLRAAGDARYTMICAMVSMWGIRIGGAFLFTGAFNMGVMGVWWAMVIDWVLRSILFFARYLQGGWQKKKLID